jgi:hypothetical protein
MKIGKSCIQINLSWFFPAAAAEFALACYRISRQIRQKLPRFGGIEIFISRQICCSRALFGGVYIQGIVANRKIFNELKSIFKYVPGHRVFDYPASIINYQLPANPFPKHAAGPYTMIQDSPFYINFIR